MSSTPFNRNFSLTSSFLGLKALPKRGFLADIRFVETASISLFKVSYNLTSPLSEDLLDPPLSSSDWNFFCRFLANSDCFLVGLISCTNFFLGTFEVCKVLIFGSDSSLSIHQMNLEKKNCS